jgi:Phage tail assembly chaperone
MVKLKLVADPTFKSTVPIPVAGAAPVEIEFEFRHRTKSALKEWVESRTNRSDLDSFLDMVTAWPGLEDEFNRANAELLLENYGGTSVATFRVYIEQLVQAKLGNSER